MIREKLINLSKYYMRKDSSKEELIAFCNQYDVIYSNFTKELERECSRDIFALLEKIFILCDSYEPNEKIRENEPYCISGEQLQLKIREILCELE